MKKLLLLLFISLSAQAQIINFPDANLKAKLLSATATNGVAYTSEFGPTSVKIDTNNNNEIEVAEAVVIKRLGLGSSGISNLSGMEYFTGLRGLTCSNNNIVSFDFSTMTSLYDLWLNYNDITVLSASNLPVGLLYFHIENNPITSFDATGLDNLQTLSLKGCELTSLTVNSLQNLTSLDCNFNNLTTLDISGMTALMNLWCGSNNLTSLNLSGASNLSDLACAANALTSLDLTGLHNLSSINFRVNGITSIDLSDVDDLVTFVSEFNQIPIIDLNKFPHMTNVHVGNNSALTTLLIKNGSIEDTVSIFNNPNLAYVCADDAQHASVQTTLTNLGLVNCAVSDYCNFTPGGDYNTITGNVRFDGNNNGCDAADFKADYLRININGPETGAAYINGAGNYTFYTGIGNHSVTPQLEQPGYFNISPVSATADFPLLDNSTIVRDFCLSANGYHPDVEIVLLPLGNARAGFEAHYQLVYKNKGNQIMSGQVTLDFEGDILDFVSASTAPTTQTGNALAWSYSNLLPFEVRAINLSFAINAPTDMPAVNAGDVLHFAAGMNFVADDLTPDDNSFALNQIVANALDPNDKTCLEGEIVTPQKIGGYLHYNINFENIGTAEAQNVVVQDIIDTAKFDVATLQVMYASHPVRALVTGNKVEFIFQDINLPSAISNPIGGHGNVLFKIKTLPTLNVGDMVTNTANIYFDYNHPIETNEARTTFALLKNQEFVTDHSVTVYPNPAAALVSAKAGSAIDNMVLFDSRGRVLETVLGKATLDISARQNGMYFLKVATEKGTKIEKIIKK